MRLLCLFGLHVPVPIARLSLAGTGGWEQWRVRCRRCGREQDYTTTPSGHRRDVSAWVRP